MKKTNRERVIELNTIIKGIKNYKFGLMPKGYAPYCLTYKGSVYAGGWFKDVRAMAYRMQVAICENRTITFDVIFGVN